MTKSPDKPETIVIGSGRMSAAHFGAVNTPVYRTSTILFPDVASMAPGKHPYSYGRRGTPTSQSLEDAIGELKKYSGIQFDPKIVPILIGLDREILDRRPERPDELPTMLHAGRPAETETAERGTPPSRPMLGSDDVS